MTYKRRLKKSKFLKLGLNFIVLVIILLVVSRLWFSAAGSKWQGRSEFSWAEADSEVIAIQTLIPEYSKQVSWRIPGNTLVKTAFGYGDYQLKNVYALGQIDARGGEILARTAQDNLGLAVKGWRVNNRTNMSWWDRVRIWWWQQFKREVHVQIDLEGEAVLEPGVLADGSEVFRVVAPKLAQLVNTTTFSQLVANENLTLTLVDASGEGIDLGQVSRLLTNHGLQVVTTVVGRGDPSENTSLSVKNDGQLKSDSVAWLKLVFPQAEVKVEPQKDYWSDLVLTLGTDYTRLL
jgi:hypothetical protein